jgi:ABC-2 type transport system permease protein
MKQVISLVYFNLKDYILDVRTLLLMMFTPLVIILSLVYALSPLIEGDSFIESFDMAIVNKDNTLQTRTLIQQIEKSQQLKGLVRFIYVDEHEALRLLQENEIASIITIPRGFSADLAVGKNTPVKVVGNLQRPLQSVLTKAWMQSSADLVTAAQSGVNTVYHFLREADLSKKELNEAVNLSIIQFSLHALGRGEMYNIDIVSSINNLSPVQYYIISGGVILLLIWSFMIILAISGGKSAALEQRLISFGISSYQLLWSRFLSITIILFTKFLFIFTLIVMLSSYDMGQHIIYFLVLALLVIMTMNAMFLLLATIIEHMILRQLFGFFIILWLSISGGSIVPLSYLPEWINFLSALSINKWAIQGFSDVLYSAQVRDQALYIPALSAMLILFLSLAMITTWQKQRWDL